MRWRLFTSPFYRDWLFWTVLVIDAFLLLLRHGEFVHPWIYVADGLVGAFGFVRYAI